jgi:hypothetical protein
LSRSSIFFFKSLIISSRFFNFFWKSWIKLFPPGVFVIVNVDVDVDVFFKPIAFVAVNDFPTRLVLAGNALAVLLLDVIGVDAFFCDKNWPAVGDTENVDKSVDDGVVAADVELFDLSLCFDRILIELAVGFDGFALFISLADREGGEIDFVACDFFCLFIGVFNFGTEKDVES